nr:uncharacterized protein LOC109146683 [Ipomoea batatas]
MAPKKSKTLLFHHRSAFDRHCPRRRLHRSVPHNLETPAAGCHSPPHAPPQRHRRAVPGAEPERVAEHDDHHQEPQLRRLLVPERHRRGVLSRHSGDGAPARRRRGSGEGANRRRRARRLVGGKVVSSPSFLADIGAGSLNFTSVAKMPVKVTVLKKLRFHINEEEFFVDSSYQINESSKLGNFVTVMTMQPSLSAGKQESSPPFDEKGIFVTSHE